VKGGQNLAGCWFPYRRPRAGLNNAQGLILTESFTGHNDQTRPSQALAAAAAAFIRRCHAACTARCWHYLKGVEALKSDDGTKVIQKMKEIPRRSVFGKGRTARGRKIHPAYLPSEEASESKYPWTTKIRATMPADQAFSLKRKVLSLVK